MKTKEGYGTDVLFAVGSVRFRTRHKRGGECRAWVKIAEPSVWILRSQFVWISKNGPIPKGMVIHHKDEDKTNDAIENLMMVSKSQHLAMHRGSFLKKAIQSFVETRRLLRWTTKSQTKRSGRHPKNCQCGIHSVPKRDQRSAAALDLPPK